MQQPQSLIGLARIMHRAFAGDDLAQLTTELSQRIAADARDAAAILDMSTILQIRGQTELAMQLQTDALQLCQHFCLQSNPVQPAIRLLAIVGPGVIMDNSPIEFLVEGGDVALELLFLGPGLPAPAELPAHDVAFVAVCQSDANEPLLKSLDEVMQHWPRPYLNRPLSIAKLSRDCVAQSLANIAGVIPSRTMRMSLDEVENLIHFADSPSDIFPLVIRPIDSHAGEGMHRLEDAHALAEYLTTDVSQKYFVAPFIDYRSADGKYRKYRVVMIDGQPYASHMAVSARWMVHYLNADMLTSADNRWEEAQFMATFDQRFAARHQAALRAIDERLQLDYYSIDCAETERGQLVVFEIDSGAVVHSMDPEDLFPYKRPQMQKVFTAFHQALAARLPKRTMAA